MRKKLNSILILVMVTIVTFFLVLCSPNVKAESSAKLQLAVYAAPPKVPADGGTYSCIVVQMMNGSQPAFDFSDVEISLVSSKTSVGVVQSRITILAGSTYAVAEFTTTETPGSTQLTATAPGFTSGSTIIATVIQSGTPSTLAIFLAPSALLPDQGIVSNVFVQLQDSAGQPARAINDLDISLSSSQTNIGTVDPEVTIPMGASLAASKFYGGYAPGTTTITASASGYTFGSAQMSVVGPIPSKLAVYATPSIVANATSEGATVTVQLQDQTGIPAKAPTDVNVLLASSNLDVGSIVESVVIPAGSTYARVQFTTGMLSGTTTVTASASGYATGQTTITARSAKTDAKMLKLYLGPTTLLADRSTHTPLFVQILDQAGNPVLNYGPTIDVALTSSKTYVGSIGPLTNISTGRSYANANFTTTFFAGSTDVTASVSGLSSAAITISTSGRIPSKLAVFSVPNQIPASGDSFNSILVQLQDNNGYPAKAYSEVNVLLTSSRSDIGSVDSYVTIPVGSSYTIANFRTTSVAGSTTVTASASGFASGSTNVVTTEPYPSKLILYAVPALVPGDYEHQNIIVQLQDSRGVPAEPLQDVEITLSSSNLEIGTVTRTVTIRKGSTYASAVFSATSVTGKTTITAISQGFFSGSVEVSTMKFPLAISLLASKSEVYVGEDAEISVLVTSSGTPVAGVKLGWITAMGSFTSIQDSTDSNGEAHSRLRLSFEGTAQVLVSATMLGFNTQSASVNITAVSASAQGDQSGFPMWMLVTIIAIVAAVATIAIIMVRR